MQQYDIIELHSIMKLSIHTYHFYVPVYWSTSFGRKINVHNLFGRSGRCNMIHNFIDNQTWKHFEFNTQVSFYILTLTIMYPFQISISYNDTGTISTGCCLWYIFFTYRYIHNSLENTYLSLS